MPIYEYKCPVHGVFEVFRWNVETDITEKCPKCSLLTSRIMSIVNANFTSWRGNEQRELDYAGGVD